MSLVREAPVLVFEFEEMGLIRKISAWKILSKKGIRRSPLLVHTTSDGCTNGSVQEDITKRKAFGITNWMENRTTNWPMQCFATGIFLPLPSSAHTKRLEKGSTHTGWRIQQGRIGSHSEAYNQRSISGTWAQSLVKREHICWRSRKSIRYSTNLLRDLKNTKHNKHLSYLTPSPLSHKGLLYWIHAYLVPPVRTTTISYTSLLYLFGSHKPTFTLPAVLLGKPVNMPLQIPSSFPYTTFLHIPLALLLSLFL